jgi:hypothetical protein
MADLKISALTAATTPLAGTEVLPIVQSSTTKKVSTDDLTVKNIRSNATSGILQVAGPAAASTRVMTTPDANFSAARIDAGQTLFGIQRFTNNTDNDASIDIYGNSTGGDPYMKGYDRNGATNFEFICDTGTTDRRFDYYGKVRVYNANFVVGTSGNGIDFSATSGSGTSELLADYEEGDFTPVPTASSGSITSYTLGTCNYTKVGRMVTINFSVTITNAGTGSGSLDVPLPFTNGAAISNGCGRENALTGSQLQARVAAAGTNMNIQNYANATAIATNAQIRATMTYFV